MIQIVILMTAALASYQAGPYQSKVDQVAPTVTETTEKHNSECLEHEAKPTATPTPEVSILPVTAETEPIPTEDPTPSGYLPYAVNTAAPSSTATAISNDKAIKWSLPWIVILSILV